MALIRMLTVGALAEQAGVKVHVMRLFLITRKVEPVGLAGRSYVYDETALTRWFQEHPRKD